MRTSTLNPIWWKFRCKAHDEPCLALKPNEKRKIRQIENICVYLEMNWVCLTEVSFASFFFRFTSAGYINRWVSECAHNVNWCTKRFGGHPKCSVATIVRSALLAPIIRESFVSVGWIYLSAGDERTDDEFERCDDALESTGGGGGNKARAKCSRFRNKREHS